MIETQPRVRPTVLEVDLGAIRANVARIRELTGTAVCGVVKADGYGHGAVAVARAALEGGAAGVAVALVEEARQLRQAGIDGPLLLLSEPPASAADAVLDTEVTPVVYREEFCDALNEAAQRRGLRLGVHVKLDTGMARVGAPPPKWRAVLEHLADRCPSLEVTGVATHLARADELTVTTTTTQLQAFDEALAMVAALGFTPRRVHIANTAGALCHPEARRDLVRIGIGMYGISPSEEISAKDAGLVPALRLVSAVSYAKRVERGTKVSYGHRWEAPRDGWVATVPIGYADGVPRRLTGRGEVVLGGRACPIAGTVTMDQLMVWCDQVEPQVGDEVVLLGRQGQTEIRVEDWARHVETITYEIVTRLASRIPRQYSDGRHDHDQSHHPDRRDNNLPGHST